MICFAVSKLAITIRVLTLMGFDKKNEDNTTVWDIGLLCTGYRYMFPQSTIHRISCGRDYAEMSTMVHVLII